MLRSRVIWRQDPNTGPIYSGYVPFQFRGCVVDDSSFDSDWGCEVLSHIFQSLGVMHIIQIIYCSWKRLGIRRDSKHGLMTKLFTKWKFFHWASPGCFMELKCILYLYKTALTILKKIWWLHKLAEETGLKNGAQMKKRWENLSLKKLKTWLSKSMFLGEWVGGWMDGGW